MILRLAAILALASTCALGQAPDSVTVSLSSQDSIIVHGQTKLDSLRDAAATEFSSIKESYDSTLAVASDASTRVSARLDSLRKLDQPVAALSAKLDSIIQWKDDRIRDLNDKVENLKSGVTEKIDNLGLPPALREKGTELNTVLDGLDISMPASDMPWNLDKATLPAIPGPGEPLIADQIPNAGDISVSDVGLGDAAGRISEYQDQLSALPTTLEETSSLAEEQALKIAEANAIDDQLGEAASVSEMTQSLPDEQAVKEELIQNVQQQAVDHFQGKEKQLHKAMETLAKYKKKYSKLEGLDQVSKKKPNPMRDKPFRRRLIPGIALQIHRKDAWMVDFNVYAGYRFNPRLIAGFGWNQRVAYNADEHEFDPGLRVYGPRLYGEFGVGEGFSARLESEYMNTRIPPRFASGNADPDGREWVYSTMAGVKKEYRFLRKINGTMLLLFNLHDRQSQSPYADKLMVRFGFEFPSQRKPAKP